MMTWWLKELTDNGEAEIVGDVSFFTKSGLSLADGHLYRRLSDPGRITGVATATRSGTVFSATAKVAGYELPIKINQFPVATAGEVELTIDSMDAFAAMAIREATGTTAPEQPRGTWRDRAIRDPVFW